ncbi:MAG: dUTP diphosphatase [Bacteroidales bacterium]|jgi:dUTP pyrophosphatase|nr:dUTP diphosphatase [Bacteroidales bacterium]MBR6176844.1 dUTP diphosphatase [Bacteroidales bacterium]MDD6000673.1 dUTP diphosphatase [Bacteroidales bacterium]
MEIKVINKSNNPLPTYSTEYSSGLDLRANLDNDLVIKPLQRVLVPTGLFIELTEGYEAQIRPRSGLAIKYGITVLNTPGTIDTDYRGEIKIILINLSNEDFTIHHGDKIAQMVIAKFEKADLKIVDSLSETVRSDGGFGHSGI